eukprot:3545388-Amphidinium_carterae.1
MVAAGAQSIPGSSTDAHVKIDADAETVPGIIGMDADAETVPGVIEALPGIVDDPCDPPRSWKRIYDDLPDPPAVAPPPKETDAALTQAQRLLALRLAYGVTAPSV